MMGRTYCLVILALHLSHLRAFVKSDTLRHHTQLIFSASGHASTHLFSIAGEPTAWITTNSLSILDTSHSGPIKWEELAYNYAAKYLVFTESTQRTVNLVQLSDEEPQYYTIFSSPSTSLHRISSLSIDWINNNLYVADERGLIYLISIKLTNGGRQPPVTRISTVYQNDALVPLSIRADPVTGHIYILMRNHDGRLSIHKHSLGGTSPQLLVSTNLSEAAGIAIHQHRSKIYWVNNLQGSGSCQLMASDLRGQNITAVGNPKPNCTCDGFDLSGNSAILTNTRLSALFVIDLETDFFKFIPNFPALPHSLIMYDGLNQPHHVHEDDCDASKKTCSQICYDGRTEIQDSGVVCLCEDGYIQGGDGESCMLDRSKMPTEHFAIVTDRTFSGPENQVKTNLYMIDFMQHQSITLPIEVQESVDHITSCYTDDICWADGSSVQRFGLRQEQPGKAIFKSAANLTIVGLAMFSQTMYINTQHSSFTILYSLRDERVENPQLINHGVYQPHEIQISHKTKFMYMRVSIDDADLEGQSDSADDVLRFDLDGTNKSRVRGKSDPSLRLLTISIDDTGGKLYLLNFGATGSVVTAIDLTSGRETTIFRTGSKIIGQISIVLDTVYFYTNTSQRYLWSRGKYDRYSVQVTSGRVFHQLAGGLWFNRLQGENDRTTPAVDNNGGTADTKSGLITGICVIIALAVTAVIAVITHRLWKRSKEPARQRLDNCPSITSSILSSPSRRSVSIRDIPLPEPPNTYHSYDVVGYQEIGPSGVTVISGASTGSPQSIVQNHRMSEQAPVPSVGVRPSQKVKNEIIMRMNSLYAGDFECHQLPDYLEATSSQPKQQNREYIEVLPSTPVPNPRKKRQPIKNANEVNTDEPQSEEEIYEDVKPQ